MLGFIQATHCENYRLKHSHTFALGLCPLSLLAPILGQNLDRKFWHLTSNMTKAF